MMQMPLVRHDPLERPIVANHAWHPPGNVLTTGSRGIPLSEQYVGGSIPLSASVVTLWIDARRWLLPSPAVTLHLLAALAKG